MADDEPKDEDKVTETELAQFQALEDRKNLKPKRKFPGFRQNVHDYFTEYTEYTGIHGFKYMGEQGRSIFEKLWWLILFCISLYICIQLIYETWIKWDTSPVLVSFARSPTPIWQIPFPAVTICSETKARRSQFNFTEAYDRFTNNAENMTEAELQNLSKLALICDNHLYNDGQKTTEFDSIEYLMKIAPQFGEMLYQCKWNLLNETCENLFTTMLTEDGMCFTFNMLDKTEFLKNNVYLHGDYMQSERQSEGWTLEDAYPKNASKDTFPRRAMSAGIGGGLFILLRAFEYDLDYICKGPVQGFKVLLHHPAEVPRVSSQYFRVPLNQEVVVAIKPDMMTTSEALKSYDAHRRNCYFAKERQLAYYQFYTQTNCQIECLTNYTLKKCGCVAYHQPHEENTPICGSGSLKCMFYAKMELLEQDVITGISSFDNEDYNVPQNITHCDCLPGCTSITYNAETSQAEFDWAKLFQAYHVNFSEQPEIQLSRLTLFFKDQQFITSERNELYGQTDFLANCGGILGLFTGFSFLSIVEIIYFMSLRLIFNVKKFGRHYWSGSPRLVNDDSYVHPK